MNAVLNINIRVASQQAVAQLGAIRSAISALQVAGHGGAANMTAGFSQFGNVLNTTGSKMVSFGKNVSWTGRQLQQTFTVPLLAAGAAATFFAFKQEAAFTQVRKVYGLTEQGAHDIDAELKVLNRTVELLSVTFGVQHEQVSKVMKDWAEAGSAGIGLQKSVFIALEAATVGSIDLEKATTGLIAIQSAYRLSTDQLRLALAQLNTIQVQSGISFSGMIDVIARSGGVARTAGIDIQHLAAMAAAIVPAAGTATQAGNALKTIISRILSPTTAAIEELHELGIEVDANSWKMKNGAERIEEVARVFGKLTDSEKTHISTVIAGRYQLNRFDILMDDINRKTGFYQSSLNATSDETQTLALYSKQLLTVLESSPQRMKIMWVMLQNALAKIIIPMIPALLGLVARIVSMVQWFGQLSPRTQQFLLVMALLLAVFGPFIRIIAVTIELFGLLLKMTGFIIIKMAQFVGWIFAQIAAHKAAQVAAIQAAATQAAAAHLAAGAYSKTFATTVTGAGLATTAIGNIATVAIGSATAGSATVTNIWSGGFARLTTIAGVATAAIGSGAAGVVVPWTAAMAELTVATSTAFGIIQAEFLMLAAGPQALALGMGVASAAITAALAAVATELAATGVIWAGIPATVTPIWAVGSAGIVKIWAGAMATIEGITLSTIAAIKLAWNGAIAALGAGTAAVAPAMLALPAVTGAAGALMVYEGGVASAAWAGTWNAGIGTVAIGMGTLAIGAGASQAVVVTQGALASAAFATEWVSGVRIISVGMAQIPASAAVSGAATTGIFGSMWAAIVAMSGTSMAAIATFIAALPIEVIVVVGLIVAAIAILAYHFRKEIGDAFIWIVDELSKLPGYFVQAFNAIVGVVSRAMQNIFGGGKGRAESKEAIQQGGEATKAAPKPGEKGFIGPVQGPVKPPRKKSPLEIFMDDMFKLPDDTDKQLTDAQKAAQDAQDALDAGLASVGSKKKKVISPLARAELDEFSRLLPELDRILASGGDGWKAQGLAIENWNEKLSDAIDTVKIADDRLKLLELAPDMVPALDALIARLGPLKTLLAAIKLELQAQQAVVDGWKTKLDAAAASLKVASDELDRLKDIAAAAKIELDDAQGVLDDLVNTPIEGMKAANDAIFANEMAIKGLKLEILKLEQAGMGIDDINKKLSLMRGALEMLRGERENLRLMGAGSEILAGYDTQIESLEDAIAGLEASGSPITALTEQLEVLQQTAEQMDLEKALKFDPLIKQIEDLTDTTKEVPFDVLYASIVKQQGVVEDLTTVWKDAEAAVKPQQKIVDDLKIAHDKIQTTYDAEKLKLDALTDSYNNVKTSVDGLTAALQNLFTTSQQEAVEELPGAGFDFPDVGGVSTIGREGGLPDMEGFNKALQASLEEMNTEMGKIDIWQPFKDMLGGIVDWIDRNAGWIMLGIAAGIVAILLGVPLVLVPLIIVAVALLGPVIWQWLQKAWDWVLERKERLIALIAFGILAIIFGVPGIVAGLIVGAVILLGPKLWEWIQLAWDWVLDHKVLIIAAIAAGILAFLLGVPLVLVGLIVAAVILLGPTLWQWMQDAWDWVMDHKVLIIAAIAAGVLAFLLGVPLILVGLIVGAVVLLGPILWQWIQEAWDWVMDNKVEIIAMIAAGVLLFLFGVPAVAALLILGAAVVIGPTLWRWIQMGWDWVMDHKVEIIAMIAGGIVLFLFGVPLVLIGLILGAVYLLGPILWGWIQSAWDWVMEHKVEIIAGIAAGIVALIFGVPAIVALAIAGAVALLGPKILEWVKGAWKWVQDHAGEIISGINWTKLLGLESIGEAFDGIWRRIKRSFALTVNFFVECINKLIGAINAVTGLLGIPKIPDIPKMDVPPAAQGAILDDAFRKVGEGFLTNTPKAIVGEGSRVHPEYVIPTDPRYRNAALKLYGDLGVRLMGKGGILGDLGGALIGGAGDLIGGAGDLLSAAGGWTVDKIAGGLRTLQKGAVTAAAQPGLALTDLAIKLIPGAYFKTLARAVKNDIYNYLKGEYVPRAFNGALIKGSTMGTLVRAGEGNKTEAIVPFPDKQIGGESHYNFYGDLSFPNITSGDDAEAFITNLERLVG